MLRHVEQKTASQAVAPVGGFESKRVDTGGTTDGEVVEGESTGVGGDQAPTRGDEDGGGDQASGDRLQVLELVSAPVGQGHRATTDQDGPKRKHDQEQAGSIVNRDARHGEQDQWEGNAGDQQAGS